MTNTHTADDYNTIAAKAGEELGSLSAVAEHTAWSHGNGNATLLQTLDRLNTLEFCVSQSRRALVDLARADGCTWQEIGDTLHTTKQAAQQRFSADRGQSGR